MSGLIYLSGNVLNIEDFYLFEKSLMNKKVYKASSLTTFMIVMSPKNKKL
jgi:hypothetical protein